MKRTSLPALIIAGLLFASLNSQAATYNFQYTFSDASVLQGVFDGTLQSDNDTVFINSFDIVQYAGVVFPTISNSAFATSPFSFGGAPRLSFSGNGLDLFVCSGGFDGDGVCNVNEPTLILDSNFSLISVTTNTENPPPDFYDPANWSLSEAPAAVPVPAAAWLFGSALIGFAGLRRKNSI